MVNKIGTLETFRQTQPRFLYMLKTTTLSLFKGIVYFLTPVSVKHAQPMQICSKTALLCYQISTYFPSNYITFALSVRHHGCKLVFQNTKSKYFHACMCKTDLLSKNYKQIVIVLLFSFYCGFEGLSGLPRDQGETQRETSSLLNSSLYCSGKSLRLRYSFLTS